jgi:hypothetical protein
MADIRVERKGGSKAWQWVLLVLVVLVLALVLAYFAGYIELPREVGLADPIESNIAGLLGLSARVSV